MKNETTTIENDIKTLHKICSQKVEWKINGEITDEYRKFVKEQTAAKIEFQSKWGKQCLTTFVIYTTLKTRLQNVPNNLNKSTFKLQNSKGNGFGNM